MVNVRNWCGRVFVLALLGFAGTALADGVFIQVTSHDTAAEAIERAEGFLHDFKTTRVYESDNGKFAVVIGQLEINQARAAIDVFKAEGLVPDDTLATDGARFVGQIWPEPDAPSAEATE